MFIFTNKTNNTYKIYCKDHEILNENRINKTCKKGPTKLEKSINLMSKILQKISIMQTESNIFPELNRSLQ